MLSFIAHQHRFIAVDKSTALCVDFIYPRDAELHPQRPVLLFVHGLGSNKAIWTETAEVMCSSYGYIGILVDLRGHGDSANAVAAIDIDHSRTIHSNSPSIGGPGSFMASNAKNNTSYSLAQSADDLATILRAFSTNCNTWIPELSSDLISQISDGSCESLASMNIKDMKDFILKSFIVIGHSYGGNVAVELAVRHPTLVSSLMLVDGGYIDLQATFPDFNSCLLALRPPSFAGIGAEELEHIVRSVWAVEGRAKNKSEENAPMIEETFSEITSIRSSVSYNGDALRRGDSASSDGSWSEVGIQAMLKNFRTIHFNPSTTTAAVRRANTDSKISTSINHDNTIFSGIHVDRSSKTVNDNMKATGGFSHHNQDKVSQFKSRSEVSVMCTQTTLSFQRYVILLEDLWSRRPADQFSALYDGALLSPSSIQEIGSDSAVGFEKIIGMQKCVVFFPSGASSPFSIDKKKDILKAIAAAQGQGKAIVVDKNEEGKTEGIKKVCVVPASPSDHTQKMQRDEDMDTARCIEKVSYSCVDQIADGANSSRIYLSSNRLDEKIEHGISSISTNRNQGEGDIEEIVKADEDDSNKGNNTDESTSKIIFSSTEAVKNSKTVSLNIGTNTLANGCRPSINCLIDADSFDSAGHNIPLQMPVQLAHTIHRYLTKISST